MRAHALPPVSVVICTRDRTESLHRTLGSLAAQDYPDFEVLVVDQSRGEGSRRLVEAMRQSFRGLRYLHLRTAGLSRAYNAGVRAARYDLLAFTDDDVVAPADWLCNIVLGLAGHPRASLLYGQVLLPDDILAHENEDGVTPSLPISSRRLLDRKHGFQVFGMGANFAARRELLTRLGGFDEVLGGGGPLQSSQDFDFVYRAYRVGATTLLEPGVFVYHYGFRGHADWPATMRSYGVGVGGFLCKHLRMGDTYAGWLFLKFLASSAARVLKRCLLRRSALAEWAFLVNMLAGARRSLDFPIDRQLRLYRDTSTAFNAASRESHE